jgi:hypothetical protein
LAETHIATQADGTIAITIHARDGRSPDDPAAAIVNADARRVAREEALFEASMGGANVVSAKQALATARKGGLATGVEPWRASLSFDPVLEASVWRVSNTSMAEHGRASGKTMTIDARSGTLLGSSSWSLDLVSGSPR